MVDEWKYQTERVILVPYTPAFAADNDGLLGYLYLQCRREGLLETAFPGMPGIYFDKFVSYLSSDKVCLQIAFKKERPGEPANAIGFCYLYNIDGEPGQRMAETGFCFFRGSWGADSHEFAWLGLAYWFEVLKVDVLKGAQTVGNVMARNFSRKFGFREEGVVTKLIRGAAGRVDGRIVTLEREHFMLRWQKQGVGKGQAAGVEE